MPSPLMLLFRVSFQYFLAYIIYTILSKVPVTAPSVSVSTTVIVAGDTVYLTCDYTLTPSVDVTVSVTWMVNGSEIDTARDGHVTSHGGQLIIFSPVTTSDSGRYCLSLHLTQHLSNYRDQCKVQRRRSLYKVLESTIFCIYHNIIKHLILFLPPVPQPGVVITLSHTPPLYAGTSLTLTCTVTLDPNVNNNERVVTEWKGPRQIAGDRYSVTPTMRESASSYNGSLVISPLTDQDDGMYTCTVRVSGGANVQSVTAHDAVTITVTGKYVPYAMEAHYGPSI